MWLGTGHSEHTDTSGPSLFSWEWIHSRPYNETRYGVHTATSGSVEVKMGKQEGGNARFNEMWVSAAHLHSSDLWGLLTRA